MPALGFFLTFLSGIVGFVGARAHRDAWISRVPDQDVDRDCQCYQDTEILDSESLPVMEQLLSKRE